MLVYGDETPARELKARLAAERPATLIVVSSARVYGASPRHDLCLDEGTPIELYEHPATRFVAGFIGSPAMNFLAARIAGDGRTIELPGGDSLALAGGGMPSEAGRAVTLGIRPEHLEMAGQGNGIAHLHIDVVEQLGADTLVHGHFGSDRTDLTVRLLGIQSFRSSETLPFAVAPEHLHLFDAETGKRIEG